MANDDPLADAVKDLERLKKELADLRAQTPLYVPMNENTPATITANQNDYDPGNYEILRINTDVGRQITGISGGIKGRMLWIYYIGTTSINLINNSASSAAANRIISSTGGNVLLQPGDFAALYYDSTSARWRTAVITQ